MTHWKQSILDDPCLQSSSLLWLVTPTLLRHANKSITHHRPNTSNSNPNVANSHFWNTQSVNMLTWNHHLPHQLLQGLVVVGQFQGVGASMRLRQLAQHLHVPRLGWDSQAKHTWHGEKLDSEIIINNQTQILSRWVFSVQSKMLIFGEGTEGHLHLSSTACSLQNESKKPPICFRIQGAVSCSVPGSGGTWTSNKNIVMCWDPPKSAQCFFIPIQQFSNSNKGLVFGRKKQTPGQLVIIFFIMEKKLTKLLLYKNLRFWPQCPWRTSRIVSCPHCKGYQELNGKPGELMVTKNTLMLVVLLAIGRSGVTKNTFDFSELGNPLLWTSVIYFPCWCMKIIPSSSASTKGWHSLMSSSKTTRKICRRPISCKPG